MIQMRSLPAILLIGLAQPGAAHHLSPSGQRKSPAPFILFVTIFDERGFAFPGAKAQLRRAGENKDRAQAQSDSRGEFAMRVPPGQEYELIVSAKGYQPNTQKVDASQSSRADLTLRLVPASKEKKKDYKPMKDKPAGVKPPKE